MTTPPPQATPATSHQLPATSQSPTTDHKPPAKSQLQFFTLAVAGLAAFAAAGLYAEPIADDYAYAVRLHWRPFWEAYFHEYQTWNGRYFSNITALSGSVMIENRWVYHLMPGLAICLLCVSLNYFLSAWLPRKVSWTMAGISSLLYLGACVRLSEVIYWYTGMVTYTAGTVLTFFAAGALIRLFKTGQVRHAVSACLFIFLAAGCNEISMALLVLIALTYAFVRGKHYPVVLATALLAAAVVYFAPGNGVRSALFPPRDLMYSLGMAALQTGRFSALTLAYLPLPLAVIWLWRSGDGFWSRGATESLRKIPPSVFAAALFSPLFLSAFMPYFSTGILGQHRTPAFGQAYLVVGLLLLPIYLKARFPRIYERGRRIFTRVPRSVFVMGVFVGLAFFGNTHHLWKETASGALAKQQRQLLHRETLIREAETGAQLEFTPLDTTLLFVIDLSADPGNWMNLHQVEVLSSGLGVEAKIAGGLIGR